MISNSPVTDTYDCDKRFLSKVQSFSIIIFSVELISDIKIPDIILNGKILVWIIGVL